MYSFTVTSARHKDANAVCGIIEKVFTPKLSSETLKELFVEIIEDVGQLILIAKNSGHVVGFIHARQQTDMLSGYYIDIAQIALLPYYRNKGAGTLLVLGVEEWGKQTASYIIRCSLKSENAAMRAILDNCGYSDKGLGVFEKTIG